MSRSLQNKDATTGPNTRFPDNEVAQFQAVMAEEFYWKAPQGLDTLAHVKAKSKGQKYINYP